jgi:hypothetical protein
LPIEPGRTVSTVRRITAPGLAELVVCACLAVVSTWPLMERPATCLPLGTESVATVPLLTTWTVWWNADRARHAYLGYWDAPIFAPAQDALAFSEPMSTSVVVAPLIWFGGNPILAHNAFLLAALTLNAWVALVLLRRLGSDRLSALLGGALVGLLPFVHHELGVLQLVPVCGILWTLDRFYQFSRRPDGGRAVWLGVAFATTYLTCAYYGLFLSVLLLFGGGWLLGRRLISGRTWGWLALSAAAFAVLAGPTVAAQLRIAREHGLQRSEDLVDRLAARPADYLTMPVPQRVTTTEAARITGPGRPLSPGGYCWALAVAGAVCGLIRHRARRWTVFGLSVLCAALVLSWGPRFEVAGWSPYTTLMAWYPGFAQVRSAFRFAVFVQLMVALLAGLGLSSIWLATGSLIQSCRTRGWLPMMGTRWQLVFSCLVTFVMVLPALAEIMPASPVVYSPPPVASQRAWMEWLAANTPTDCVIARLPLPPGDSAAEFEREALRMYWGTYHHRRMVNGYSGFLPEAYLDARRCLAGFPDDQSLRWLRDNDVSYCVVSSSLLDPGLSVACSTPGSRLRRVFTDGRTGLDVYRLEPVANAARPSPRKR